MFVYIRSYTHATKKLVGHNTRSVARKLVCGYKMLVNMVDYRKSTFSDNVTVTVAYSFDLCKSGSGAKIPFISPYPHAC